MNVVSYSKKILSVGLVTVSMAMLSTLTGCLTDDKKDTPPASDPVTTKDATLGAQSNATAGSFLDADAMTGYTCPDAADCPAKAVAAKIDLVFAFSGSASASAIYSPVVARDGLTPGNGFAFVTTALGTSARS